MPYAWVEPIVLLEYAGVSIYHAYDDEDMNKPLFCWYTVDVTEEQPNLDIRDLPEYDPQLSHEEIFRRAIDNKSSILMEHLKTLEE